MSSADVLAGGIFTMYARLSAVRIMFPRAAVVECRCHTASQPNPTRHIASKNLPRLANSPIQQVKARFPNIRFWCVRPDSVAVHWRLGDDACAKAKCAGTPTPLSTNALKHCVPLLRRRNPCHPTTTSSHLSRSNTLFFSLSMRSHQRNSSRSQHALTDWAGHTMP
jgi:hypothetical protein